MIKLFEKKYFPLIISFIAFLIVFILNLKINLLFTALIRGVFTFIIFYSIGTIVNFVFFTDEVKKTEKGLNVKMETPMDDLTKLMNEVYNTNSNETDAEFKPMEFKKIEFNEDEKIDETIKGIRQWTQDK